MTDWIKAAAPALLAVAVGAGAMILALAGLGFFADLAEDEGIVVTTVPNPQAREATLILDAAIPAHLETATFALG